jgi:hypothetical protein
VTDRTTDDRTRPTEPLQPEKSLGELFGELGRDLSTLMRQEVELAKSEAREEMRKAGKAAGMFAGAGVGAWSGVLLLAMALAWLLDQWMNRALAFALVGVLLAVIAAVLAMRGKRYTAEVKPLPNTVDTLKEDAQWAKTQMS